MRQSRGAGEPRRASTVVVFGDDQGKLLGSARREISGGGLGRNGVDVSDGITEY
jgi:hypothetical protein